MKSIFEQNEQIITLNEKQELKEKYKGKYNIVFMGTPDFAVPVLEAIDDIFGIQAVVTVPDKPQGRGLVLSPSAVKKQALERGLQVLQPEKLKQEDFIDKLQSFTPDIFCVVAFRILPEVVFQMPKLGSFNIHGSLLPKFRGAAPINRAIMAGETETGLTSFLLNKIVDQGNILLKSKIEIGESLIASELYEKLKPQAADLAVKTIQMLIEKSVTPIIQDDNLSSAAPKLFPNQSFIDWNKNKAEVKCFINGLSLHPGARTYLNEKLFKILRATTIFPQEIVENLLTNHSNQVSGQILCSKDKLFVKCNDDYLELLQVQLEGKKVMDAKDFVSGFKKQIDGLILTSPLLH